MRHSVSVRPAIIAGVGVSCPLFPGRRNRPQKLCIVLPSFYNRHMVRAPVARWFPQARPRSAVFVAGLVIAVACIGWLVWRLAFDRKQTAFQQFPAYSEAAVTRERERGRVVVVVFTGFDPRTNMPWHWIREPSIAEVIRRDNVAVFDANYDDPAIVKLGEKFRSDDNDPGIVVYPAKATLPPRVLFLRRLIWSDAAPEIIKAIRAG